MEIERWNGRTGRRFRLLQWAFFDEIFNIGFCIDGTSAIIKEIETYHRC